MWRKTCLFAAGLGAPEGFLDNAVALVNTADEAMNYLPCWHISLPCNCDFDRPPSQDKRDFLCVKVPPGVAYPLFFGDTQWFVIVSF